MKKVGQVLPFLAKFAKEAVDSPVGTTMFTKVLGETTDDQ
jgi:hypothetical protein